MDQQGHNVVIVGCGLGTHTTLTSEAEEAIREAEIVLGTPRLVDALVPPGQTKKACADNAEIMRRLEKYKGRSLAVLVSGDPGYYSGARELLAYLSGQARIVPGVSCLSALCAKLHVPEDEVRTINVQQGDNVNISYEISRSKFTCVLTADGTARTVLKSLYSEGLGELKVAAGSRLGQDGEEIYEGTVSEAKDMEFPEPVLLLIWNTDWARYSVIGLPDQAFFRGTVPMTKFEVRNIAASKMEVRANDIIYDVGAGTGSVSVELSRRAYLGKVYSIERLPEAFYLLRKNRQHLRAFNLEIVSGEAPEAFADLPAPDKVFIGGSGGNIDGIIKAVLQKNPNALIVATAATLETLQSARSALSGNGCHIEVVHEWASRLEPRGSSYTMFEAINPVFIIVGRPHGRRR